MRFWTRLPLLLLFPLLVVCEDDIDTSSIPDCPDNKVCINLVKTTCYRNDVEIISDGGSYTFVLWAKGISRCDWRAYSSITAALEFEFLTLQTWTVILTRWEDYEKTKFKFANATLEFKGPDSNPMALFTWTSNGNETTVPIPMETLPPIDPELLRFKRRRYSFNITANGEKLITLFAGDEVKYLGYYATTLKDQNFTQALEDHTTCDISETKMLKGEECHGDCDGITYNEAPFLPNKNILECSSKLWFRTPEEGELMRTWQGVDNITCHMGSWQANWGQKGKQVLDSSHEVQCSSEEPPTMTGKMKLILGFSIGGGVLLLIGVIVGVVICVYMSRRRAINSQSKAGTFSASVAATPKNNSIH